MHARSSPCMRRARGAVLGLALGCMLAGAAATAWAEELGRLFFTPQQRQELDRRRAMNVPEPAEVGVESLVTVNGQVARSSGRTTTWINGVPQYDTYRGRAADRVVIRTGDNAVAVKVGQTLDQGQGRVQDPLQGGRVSVHAPARR